MIWIIVVIIIAAGFAVWSLMAMASRGSREEDRRQLAHDIEKFLAELEDRNHGG